MNLRDALTDAQSRLASHIDFHSRHMEANRRYKEAGEKYRDKCKELAKLIAELEASDSHANLIRDEIRELCGEVEVDASAIVPLKQA